MQYQILTIIAKNKLSWFFLTIFAGMTCGSLIIVLFLRLPATYASFILLAIISPFIAIIIGDSKRTIWLLLCVFLPVTVDVTINHTGHLGGAAGIIISLYDIVLALLYFLWIIEIISKREIKIDLYPEISLPFLLLLGFSSLSVIPAKYPELCVYEIIEIIKMYLTFVYLANNIKTKNDVQFILNIFILSLFFEGLLGFAQHRYDMPLFPTALGGASWLDSRVKGTWVSYNDFAWYLTFFLPLSMSMIFSKIKTIYKLFCLLTFALASGALIWTNSRSGWISLGVAVLFVGLLVFCKINTKKTLINKLLTVVFILILILPLYPRLYNKVYGRFAGSDRGSAESRFPQFEVAFNIIKANPILGVGINNYTESMKEYDDTEEGLATITEHPVHNIFLHIAAEIGIFGLAIFLWLLAVIFFKGVIYVMLNESFMVYAVIGMLGGILAFLIHGLYDVASIGSKMFSFVWFFAGLTFAIVKILPKSDNLQKNSRT